jgi:hypothetical protein
MSRNKASPSRTGHHGNRAMADPTFVAILFVGKVNLHSADHPAPTTETGPV